MQNTYEKRDTKIILVAAPWTLYSRPSIQLGALKGFLKKQHPSVKVDAYHLYLKVAEYIGYQVYHAVSQRTWPAECVYGALLYPDRKPDIERLFRRETRGDKDLSSIDFQTLISKVQNISDAIIRGLDWSGYKLAGFSLCLCQLTASLYFIRRIKKSHPELPIVAGGSLFTGDLANDFVDTFKEIDFYINGEGEIPLAKLVEQLEEVGQCRDRPPDPAIVTRKSPQKGFSPSISQYPDLENLPTPAYDDYFRLLKTVRSNKNFFPTLPMEISRGCWWSSGTSSSKGKGCAFCNLNLQWEGYRYKRTSQIVSEMEVLTSRHKVLSVAFTDNLLPLKSSPEVFAALSDIKKDLKLFGEIRATTPKTILERMKYAGAQKIQIGIEALSTCLLEKLHKGTSAIQNLQIMRDCEELGISNISNLILQFPRSTPEDVEETLRTLAFTRPFHPLKTVTFWLGYGSPVWNQRDDYGLKAVRNHPHYGILFPKSICRKLSFMIQTYRGDRVYQKKLWKPVQDTVKAWANDYQALHTPPFSSPILTFRDGRDFMIIHHKRCGKAPVIHRLVGTSRSIYLFCCRHRSLTRILAKFPKLTEDKVLPFLKMMVDKKVMFEEKGRYLSLAVPISRNNLS
jgi:ribosomal peptide maturation radical SAM protein 1